jgi:hypothetical protein
VRLFARPTLVSGGRPALPPLELPPFTDAASDVGDSARIVLEARLDYALLGDAATRALQGRSFTRWNRRVRVDEVRVVGLGDGRLAVRLRFAGAVRGEGWLVGTPALDSTTGTVRVPDLDFDVATGNLLVQGLAFLQGPAVLEALRTAAVFPLGDPLDALRVRVEGAMNRELTDGVHLTARLQSARLASVHALPEALVVRAETRGQLGLGIDRALTPRARR